MTAVLMGSLLPLTSGCGGKFPENALVVTQSPASSVLATDSSSDILDQRYPPGSRVVLATPPFAPAEVRVLSKGLLSAGNPVTCFTGQRVFFAGKKTANDDWQIYEANPRGGHPKARTSIPGGAMDPAVIASGDLVFSSPVPRAGQLWSSERAAAIFSKSDNNPPQRLTFGTSAAIEPTVLSDGRILFVSAPQGSSVEDASAALFTINNDGTEVTAFALTGQDPLHVRRPRELPDGKIAFLSADANDHQNLSVETVLMARPFISRSKLLPFAGRRVHSVESGKDGAILACVDGMENCTTSAPGSAAVHKVPPEALCIGEPLFADPEWRCMEATLLTPREKPMGRVSTVNQAKSTGILLCLNANFTRGRNLNGEDPAPAQRVRLSAATEAGKMRVLGEVPLQPDGSFMVQVPADTALGIESLDADGQVLHSLPPMLWVRPGENRSCVGCHEPYNRSPRNQRPAAVDLPPALLSLSPQTIAHHQ
jgi:hypothetical protein